ncbi:hypothetical protein N407_06380 [Helicobacter pylori FD662]|nr:hypothetical protein N407_06380 [Helicobacter pylori FD662]
MIYFFGFPKILIGITQFFKKGILMAYRFKILL